jgi:hypothetical protein
MEFQCHPIPPPSVAPRNSRGETLDLVQGLNVSASIRQFRCGNCHKMQPTGSEQVWVPDGVAKDDPAWSVEESCRISAYNGHFSAWCVRCAPKANGEINTSPMKPESVVMWIVGVSGIVALLSTVIANAA